MPTTINSTTDVLNVMSYTMNCTNILLNDVSDILNLKNKPFNELLGAFNCSTNKTEDTQPLNSASRTSDSDIWPWRVGLFGLGGTIMACLGIISNIIAIIVLAHYRTKSTAPFLLIILAVCDTTFLLSELFLETLTYLAQGGVISDSYREFIRTQYCFFFPVPQVARTMSAYMIVLITLERYIVVAWPLAALTLLRPKLARLVVMSVLCVIGLYHTPLYMAYTCSKVYNNHTQRHTTRFHRTSFGKSDLYTQIYHTWIHLIAYFVLPFLVLSVTNILLLRALRNSQMESSRATDIQRRVHRERRLTLMVLTMTGLFFLCYLFSAVSFILTTGLNKYSECSIHCNRFSAIADTVIILNSAINFAIYCVAGKKFRDVFREVFCGNALSRAVMRSRPGSAYTISANTTTTTTTSTISGNKYSSRYSTSTTRDLRGDGEGLALLLCCSCGTLKRFDEGGFRFRPGVPCSVTETHHGNSQNSGT